MKALGIIAEYNPFHKGHYYHLLESKKASGADACVAVMSGNFTQRGDAALLSKWERSKIAVDCGIDLVLELPFVYACNNAEIFAKGAVQILNGLNFIDTVSFGSESGELTKLAETAEIISNETPAFKKSIREHLDKGFSYPKARALAVRDAAGEEAANILNSPNNILAVEYIKQLCLSGSKMIPLTIKRKGQDYNSTIPDGEFSSAAAIRNCLNETGSIDNIKEYVPIECLENIKNLNININKIINNMFLLISSRIITEKPEDLEKIFSAGEGLGSKLKKAMRDSSDLDELLMAIKSKRYTMTRIKRLLVHTLFNLSAIDFNDIESRNLNYARVLAFNDKGAALLKKAKAAGPLIPVITNIKKQVKETDDIMKILKYDIAASDVYNLISGRDISSESDFVTAPYHKF